MKLRRLIKLGHSTKMSEDSYTPLIDREREPESRVHNALTDRARDRLAAITLEVSVDYSRGLDLLKKKLGYAGYREQVELEEPISEPDAQVHSHIVYHADTEVVLTHLEQVILAHHKSKRRMDVVLNNNASDFTELAPMGGTQDLIDEIEHVLVTEGILWTVEPAGKGGVIEFRPLESEALSDIDSELQVLAEGDDWGDSLRGYNDAFQRYLNGDFDDTLVTKLYNSIEEVLKRICVDIEGWTDDRDMGHGAYLEILREKEVYATNGITAPEINDMLDSLEKMVSKVGHDRKQRHAYHDRQYCTLLIHQVGAYLYFIINRYEDYAEQN